MARPRLTFLVHRGKDYTLRHYFKTWGAAVRDRIAIRTYPGVGVTGRSLGKRLNRRLKAWRTGTLDPGRGQAAGAVYAFTDLEILAPWERKVVADLCHRLAGSAVILNDPAAALTRFELLRALRRADINSFDVRRARDGGEPTRWPVYTRDDRSHDDDSISELLDSPRELARHLAELAERGADLGQRTVVEYAGAASTDGLFRKYAAMRLGDAIVPCHIFFGRHWVVKHSAVFDRSTSREELDYIEANPHQEVLRRAFEIAGIGYGRVDYGVVDGRVEVWEINTNPYIIRPEYTRQEARCDALAAFSERFNAALVTLLDR